MNGEAAHEAGSEVHGAGAPGAPGSQREPSEEELRAAYEAELSRLTSADVMVNACVTLLSIGGRRLGGPAGEEPQGAGAGGEAGARDLEQVREAIDGARALLGVLERRLGKELGPLRDALSRLQMAYAREARGAAAAAGSGEQGGGSAGARQGPDAGTAAQQPPGPSEQPGAPPEEGERQQPGPAESSGRLWVPGR
jgi:hypothetical protein